MKNLWGTVRFSTWKDFSVLTDFRLRTTLAGGQFLADFRRKKIDFLALELWPLKTELGIRTSQTFWVSRLKVVCGERKDIFYLFRLTFRSCGLKVHLDREKRKNKTKKRISPTTRKKRKPVSGLSGERFTGKFFRLLICSFLTEFLRTRQEIHKTCSETFVEKVWILKIIR